MGVSLGDIAGDVVRLDESLMTIGIQRSAANAALFNQFNAYFRAMMFRVCYCFIQDRGWLSNLRTLQPPEVRSCPVPAHPFSRVEMAER